MPSVDILSLPHRAPAILAAAFSLLAILLLFLRHKTLGRPITLLLAAALLLLPLLAGGARLALPDPNTKILVLVDDSPSTRTAAYHDPIFLQRRLAELIPSLPYEIRHFSDTAGQTTLPTLPAAPTLLFSDGQFPLPSSTPAPLYPILDPNLLSIADAQITAIITERGQSIALLNNQGPSRTLTINNQALPLPPGRHRIPLGRATASYHLSLSPADLWPENDLLTHPGQSPDRLAPWSTFPLAGTQLRSPLPSDPAGYLYCAVLLLDADTAASLTPAQQTALARYVRDLGGSLILIGSTPAWTSLRGTTIADLSPLSIDPPTPQSTWLLLLDASGSMAQVEGSATKWQHALAAAQTMLRGIPAADPVQLGSFAQDVRWWSTSPAAQTQLTPPPGLTPRGPTNLLPALTSVLNSASTTPRHLLLLTDAEIDLPDPESLAARLQSANIRLSCLLLAEGRGRASLSLLSQRTAGQLLLEPNPQLWSTASRQLLSQLAPAQLHSTPLPLTLTWPFPNTTHTPTTWLPSYPRQGATPAAHPLQNPESRIPNPESPPSSLPSSIFPLPSSLSAHWRLSTGQVTALTFAPTPDLLATLIANTQSTPTPADVEITWPTTPPYLLHVRSPHQPILHLSPLAGPATQTPLPLTAPNHYTLSLPDSWRGAHAALFSSSLITPHSSLIARHILPPTYPPEFANLGTNLSTLTSLAQSSSAQLISPDHRTPLPITLPPRHLPLLLPLSLLTLLLLTCAILLLRRRQ